MSQPTFVHLHCHTDGSLLDGGNPIDKLVQRAVTFGMPALAVTDHGVMYSAWEFYETAKKKGLKPIIGMEAYVAPGHRADKTLRFPPVPRRLTALDGDDADGGPAEKAGKHAAHLILLARDRQGYKNLTKLTSIGHTEGLYRGNPRIDHTVLEQYSEGLIVTSACLAGEVAQALMRNDWDEARRIATWYATVFKDRYYLEVQAHHSEGQAELNARIFALADELGLPVVATNDAHFLTRDDHKSHDTLICIGMGKDVNDPKRLRYDEDLYFKSAEEMAAAFPDRPDVLANTLAIADACQLAFEKRYYVPNFPIPTAQREALRARVADAGGPDAVLPSTLAAKGLDAGAAEQAVLEITLLRELAEKGARVRYGDPLPDPIRERLAYELDVITSTGYAGYHLIVADFIQAARDRGIPVGPGRGSAAGSLVCYALGITDICPITYDLLFERFLNPDRVSMPDIDVDFCFERRGEVIDYVRDKYGRDAVCQIVTFGTMKARAVVKDVGRTLGFTPAETDNLAKLIPNAPNNSLTVAEAIEKVPKVQRLYASDPPRMNFAGTASYRELLDMAMKLEGLRRHTGVHAAGVVIAPGPVDDYVPIATQTTKGAGGGEDDRVIVAQYDMECLEKAGMLKMDFLGLSTLTVIHDAIQSIRAVHPEVRFDWRTIDLNDPTTYELLRKGRTAGVFQLESNLATDKLAAMRVDCFDDIVAANALLRPGPLDSGMTDKFIKRKRGEEPVEAPHPMLADALKDTQGIIVYQEQVMRAAQILANYTLAEADVLRKAVGKKDAELIKAELGKFVAKAVAAGTCTQLQAEQLAALIETFGRYGFNKSHSAAYSLLSFQTAYLKAHYPAHFMAALLSSVVSSTDDVVKYVAECRELGVPVLPPDVNESTFKFNVVPGTDGREVIRFGLGAIKNVGKGVIDAILAARAEGGAFKTFFDFVDRMAGAKLNTKALESLIAAGACDALGANRAQMLAIAKQALEQAAKRKRDQELGQGSLFDLLGEDAAGAHTPALTLPKLPELDARDRLAKEKEVLGMYVSGHPLEHLADIAKMVASHQASQCREYQPGTVRIAGVVTQCKPAIAKRSGRAWAKAVIEDLTGGVNVMLFPDVWARFDFLMQEGSLVVVEGYFDDSDRDSDKAPDLRVERVQGLLDAVATHEVAVKIRLDSLAKDETSMEHVRRILAEHQGPSPVLIETATPAGAVTTRTARARVSPNPDLIRALRAVLGTDRIELVKGLANAAANSGSRSGARAAIPRAPSRARA